MSASDPIVAALRAIAATLEARADAGQKLDPAEMRDLARALTDLAHGEDDDHGAASARSETVVVALRPVWRGKPGTDPC